MVSVAVFSGSALGQDSDYVVNARKLGKEFAQRRIRLVCGGGGTGLMKVIAETVLENGGEVSAVVPLEMADREIINEGIAHVLTVATIDDRKKTIQSMADAFVILPGGVGMMDEFFYVYSQAKLGIHGKPIGMLNTNGFFSPVLTILENMVCQNFMKEKHLALISVSEDPSVLMDTLFRRSLVS